MSQIVLKQPTVRRWYRELCDCSKDRRSFLQSGLLLRRSGQLLLRWQEPPRAAGFDARHYRAPGELRSGSDCDAACPCISSDTASARHFRHETHHALGRGLTDCSPEILGYVERETEGIGKVELVNASDHVELVETGAFLADVDRTLVAVRAKLDTLHPNTDATTWSSTHLRGLLAASKKPSSICVSSIQQMMWWRRLVHTPSPARGVSDSGAGAKRLRCFGLPPHAQALRAWS